MVKKIKVGDRVRTLNGFEGTVKNIQYHAACGSTCSYISRVEILLENGMILESLPETVEVLVST